MSLPLNFVPQISDDCGWDLIVPLRLTLNSERASLYESTRNSCTSTVAIKINSINYFSHQTVVYCVLDFSLIALLTIELRCAQLTSTFEPNSRITRSYPFKQTNPYLSSSLSSWKLGDSINKFKCHRGAGQVKI